MVVLLLLLLMTMMMMVLMLMIFTTIVIAIVFRRVPRVCGSQAMAAFQSGAADDDDEHRARKLGNRMCVRKHRTRARSLTLRQ